jgi:hypothetical protein
MVFGTMNLVVSVPVENENETLALMEANYKFANIIVMRCMQLTVEVIGRKYLYTKVKQI